MSASEEIVERSLCLEEKNVVSNSSSEENLMTIPDMTTNIMPTEQACEDLERTETLTDSCDAAGLNMEKNDFDSSSDSRSPSPGTTFLLSMQNGLADTSTTADNAVNDASTLGDPVTKDIEETMNPTSLSSEINSTDPNQQEKETDTSSSSQHLTLPAKPNSSVAQATSNDGSEPDLPEETPQDETASLQTKMNDPCATMTTFVLTTTEQQHMTSAQEQAAPAPTTTAQPLTDPASSSSPPALLPAESEMAASESVDHTVIERALTPASITTAVIAIADELVVERASAVPSSYLPAASADEQVVCSRVLPKNTQTGNPESNKDCEAKVDPEMSETATPSRPETGGKIMEKVVEDQEEKGAEYAIKNEKESHLTAKKLPISVDSVPAKKELCNKELGDYFIEQTVKASERTKEGMGEGILNFDPHSRENQDKSVNQPEASPVENQLSEREKCSTRREVLQQEEVVEEPTAVAEVKEDGPNDNVELDINVIPETSEEKTNHDEQVHLKPDAELLGNEDQDTCAAATAPETSEENNYYDGQIHLKLDAEQLGSEELDAMNTNRPCAAAIIAAADGEAISEKPATSSVGAPAITTTSGLDAISTHPQDGVWSPASSSYQFSITKGPSDEGFGYSENERESASPKETAGIMELGISNCQSQAQTEQQISSRMTVTSQDGSVANPLVIYDVDSYTESYDELSPSTSMASHQGEESGGTPLKTSMGTVANPIVIYDAAAMKRSPRAPDDDGAFPLMSPSSSPRSERKTSAVDSPTSPAHQQKKQKQQMVIAAEAPLVRSVAGEAAEAPPSQHSSATASVSADKLSSISQANRPDALKTTAESIAAPALSSPTRPSLAGGSISRFYQQKKKRQQLKAATTPSVSFPSTKTPASTMSRSVVSQSASQQKGGAETASAVSAGPSKQMECTPPPSLSTPYPDEDGKRAEEYPLKGNFTPPPMAYLSPLTHEKNGEPTSASPPQENVASYLPDKLSSQAFLEEESISHENVSSVTVASMVSNVQSQHFATDNRVEKGEAEHAAAAPAASEGMEIKPLAPIYPTSPSVRETIFAFAASQIPDRLPPLSAGSSSIELLPMEQPSATVISPTFLPAQVSTTPTSLEGRTGFDFAAVAVQEVANSSQRAKTVSTQSMSDRHTGFDFAAVSSQQPILLHSQPPKGLVAESPANKGIQQQNECPSPLGSVSKPPSSPNRHNKSPSSPARHSGFSFSAVSHQLTKSPSPPNYKSEVALKAEGQQQPWMGFSPAVPVPSLKGSTSPGRCTGFDFSAPVQKDADAHKSPPQAAAAKPISSNEVSFVEQQQSGAELQSADLSHVDPIANAAATSQPRFLFGPAAAAAAAAGYTPPHSVQKALRAQSPQRESAVIYNSEAPSQQRYLFGPAAAAAAAAGYAPTSSVQHLYAPDLSGQQECHYIMVGVDSGTASQPSLGPYPTAVLPAPDQGQSGTPYQPSAARSRESEVIKVPSTSSFVDPSVYISPKKSTFSGVGMLEEPEQQGGRLWKLAGQQTGADLENPDEEKASPGSLKRKQGPGARLAETFKERMRSRADPDAVVATPSKKGSLPLPPTPIQPQNSK